MIIWHLWNRSSKNSQTESSDVLGIGTTWSSLLTLHLLSIIQKRNKWLNVYLCWKFYDWTLFEPIRQRAIHFWRPCVLYKMQSIKPWRNDLPLRFIASLWSSTENRIQLRPGGVLEVKNRCILASASTKLGVKVVPQVWKTLRSMNA